MEERKAPFFWSATIWSARDARRRQSSAEASQVGEASQAGRKLANWPSLIYYSNKNHISDMSHHRRQEKRLPVAKKKEACFYRQKESRVMKYDSSGGEKTNAGQLASRSSG